MDQNVCVLLFPFIRPVEDHPSEHTLSGTEQSGKTVNFVKSAFYFGRMFLLICFFFKNLKKNFFSNLKVIQDHFRKFAYMLKENHIYPITWIYSPILC